MPIKQEGQSAEQTKEVPENRGLRQRAHWCGTALRRVAAVVLLTLAIQNCTPEFRPPYDPTQAGYGFDQTFGQLISFDGQLRVAYFVVLHMPAGEFVKAFADGTIKYDPNFQGLGPTVIFDPKDYFSSDTSFESVEGLPRPAKLKFALAHLVEAEVQAAVEQRYTQLGVSNPAAAAQRFIQRHPETPAIDVIGSPKGTTQSILGKADGNALWIAAFTGEADAVEEFVNPLPYLIAGTAAASRDAIDDQPPAFQELWFQAADNAAMLGAAEYQVPASNIIGAPNILFGNISIIAKIEDKVSTAGENIGIYELAYEINQITRNPDNSIATRTPRSKGRHLANRMPATGPPSYVAIYDSARSSAGTRTFAYDLHFDATTPPASEPDVRNYLTETNLESLDVTEFPEGEYEFVIKARDARMAPRTYVTRTVFATISNDPAAIAAAKWSLQASFGPESVDINNGAQPAFLIIPGTTAPFTVPTQINNAPSTTPPAAFRYTILSNNTNVAPGSDASLFPNGDDIYTGVGGTTLPLTFSGEGLHEISVWLDQDGDGTRQESEPSRRLIIMTYEIGVTVTAERKHLGAPYAALAPNTPIPSADSLKLTATASGFQPGDEALANFSWEVTSPAGQEMVAGNVWEKDPLPQGGVFTAKAIVELFGVKFEETWSQTVIGAQITALQAVCENEDRNVAVTLAPSPLPGAAQVNYSIQGPANAADGAAQFTAGGLAATGNASGNLQIRGTNASTARDNVALVAQFDGAEIAREPISICGIRFLDNAKNNATRLLIARWDNAYTAAFAMRNGAAEVSNFIGRDIRRWYVRVIDHSKDLDPAVADTLNAEIGTAGSIVDDYSQLRLTETGNNTGIFESMSQMLMSPDLPVGDHADDNFRAHDGINGSVADDTQNDRTHRASTHGRVRFRYHPDPTVQYESRMEICQGVPNWRRTLHIRQVHIFNEPFQDTGYGSGNGVLDFFDLNRNRVADLGEGEAFVDTNANGIYDAGEPFTDLGYGAGNNRFDFTDSNHNDEHDAGEASERFRDISNGSPAFLNVGSRGGVVTTNQVQNQISRANLAWAQACIRITLDGTINFEEAPTRVIAGTPVSIIQSGTFAVGGLDEAALIGAYAPAAVFDRWEVFFVPSPPGRAWYGLSRGPIDMVAGLGEKTFAYIAHGLDIRFRTLAHEAGHALDNGSDANNTQIIFYPANNTFMDDHVNSYRRIAPATETNARTPRAAGAMMATGNRLLKTP